MTPRWRAAGLALVALLAGLCSCSSESRAARPTTDAGVAPRASAGVHAVAVAPSSDDGPREGDIVFQTSRSAQSKAIQRATKSRYSHVGIVQVRKGGAFVYEAVGPVKLTPLAAWVARGEGGGYVRMRLRRPEGALTASEVASLRHAAERFRGRPYDLAFAWSDDRIYCSELVWKIYKEALGIELTAPQHLRDFDLSNPLVKAKLRERYGEHVPLDEPVVSPGALAESALLEVVAGP